MAEEQAVTDHQPITPADLAPAPEVDPGLLVEDPNDVDLFAATDEEVEQAEEQMREDAFAEHPGLEAIVEAERENLSDEELKEEEDTGTEPPVVETPSSEESAPKEAPPDTEVPLDQLDLPDAFTEEINQMSQEALAYRLQQLHQQPATPPTPPETTSGAHYGQPPPTPPPAPSSPAFVTAEEWEAAQQSHDTFNQLLARTAARAQQEAIQEAIKQIPHVAQQMINNSLQAYSVRHEFFESNKDLKPFASFVELQSNNLVRSHPDWTTEQLLAALPDHTRKMLNEVQRRRAAADAAPRPPAVDTPRAASGRKPASRRTAFQKDFDDLIV